MKYHGLLRIKGGELSYPRQEQNATDKQRYYHIWQKAISDLIGMDLDENSNGSEKYGSWKDCEKDDDIVFPLEAVTEEIDEVPTYSPSFLKNREKVNQ